jgi:hypothetical protein
MTSYISLKKETPNEEKHLKKKENMKVWEKICHEYLNSCNKTNKQGIEHVAIAFAIVIKERSRPARVWFKLNIYARKSFF